MGWLSVLGIHREITRRLYGVHERLQEWSTERSQALEREKAGKLRDADARLEVRLEAIIVCRMYRVSSVNSQL